ncbi:HlyD family secretion protein [Enterococcus sp. PF1-24]|uniref:efflux RND transporter periplasmic adaptor subunit n=1 Tax=unclassified Enterococcus TaxID=2608891 RepID=UPI002475C511|nr:MULTISPECIES: efflux RND transporter periplasmic adaptor subunit [unclassified Enterococcus]MDH6365747.1 HlyD family secretion protein [Enterococcus sp. PFB1-1]MDH6402847.1 HlyD family secretion protein [Enterococcus sp. PF1-24]
MKKSKKLFIPVTIAVGVIIIACLTFIFLNKPKANSQTAAPAEDLGIEYFETPDFEQVYINGMIQPEQEEAFVKEQKDIGEPQIQVENGAVVEAGTILYTYEDKAITTELDAQNNAVSKLYTQRENTVAKWNRAVANYWNTSEAERMTTKAAIDEQYQGEIDTIDQDIYFTNATIADLQSKQNIAVPAKFTGRVAIPEVKDQNTPILHLTADGLYMAGTINEKDLAKINLEQQVIIRVVSDGTTVNGRIVHIDETPQVSSEIENTSMSTYTVKIALDSLEGIKNGYHVQGTINLSENAIVEVPSQAIHEENGSHYVLVNDFGSVIRRVVQTGEIVGLNTQVLFGLESADQIIVSSKNPVAEGDLIDAPVAE